MMNKNEFLEALKRALAVLDEAELQDIIDEYEQHIDMKTANGLTEEEAIADFGDFKELTAELLEAYHVRADYAEVNRFQTESFGKGRAYQAQAGYGGTNGSKPEQAASAGKTAEQEDGSATCGAERTGWLRNRKPVAADGGAGNSDQGFAAGLWKRISGVCSRLWQGTKSAAGWLRNAAKQTGIRLWKALLWCWHKICRPFVWLAGLLGFGAGAASGGRTVPDGAEEPALSKEKKGGGRVMGRRSIWAVMGGGIAAFCRGCVGACVWCIRMAWNAFCICTSVFVGILGIFFLFAFGMLAILVISGYPLGGAVIGVLGATVSFFAAAGFVMTLLWKKRPAVEAAAPGETEVNGREEENDHA